MPYAIEKRPHAPSPPKSVIGTSPGSPALQMLGNSLQRTQSALAQSSLASRLTAQRKISIDNKPMEDEALEECSPAEKSLFKRWQEDAEIHNYNSRSDLINAIKRSVGQIFGGSLSGEEEDQVATFKKAIAAGYRTFDTATRYDTLNSLARAIEESGVPKDEFHIIYKITPNDDEDTNNKIKENETYKSVIQSEKEQLEGIMIDLKNKIKTMKEGTKEHKEIDDKISFEDKEMKKINQKLTLKEMYERSLKKRLVRSQITNAYETLGFMPQTLMLHEMGKSTKETEGTLGIMRSFLGDGPKGAKDLGVSNVNVHELPELIKVFPDIKHVQNKFSPYQQDSDVREVCKSNNIRYSGYSLLGNAQQGVCASVGEEGAGDPRNNLLAGYDPRLIKMAGGNDKVAPLLGQWSQAKGISPIMMSSNEARIKLNFDIAAHDIDPALFTRMEEEFTRSPLETAKREQMEQRTTEHSGLRDLYRSQPDPSVWFWLDFLSQTPDEKTLLNALAIKQNASLPNLALSLIRHVGDIQSSNAYDAFDGKIDRATAPQHTMEMLTDQFGALSAAAKDPDVFDKFSNWIGRQSHVGNTMKLAQNNIGLITNNSDPMHE